MIIIDKLWVQGFFHQEPKDKENEMLSQEVNV